MLLTDQVDKIHNIGAQRLKYLNNMGIYTVSDLIEYFPRDYDDRSDIKLIDELDINQPNTFYATVSATADTVRIKNMVVTTLRVKDDTGVVYCVWYNQGYLKNAFKVGESYIFTGKYQLKYNKKQIISPEYERLDKNVLLSGGRIMPLYPTTKGISQKILRGLIKDTLDKTKNQLTDFIPKNIRMENQLCDRNFAILNIHFPESDESFFIARSRLVFEELFILQMALLSIKTTAMDMETGVKIIDTKMEEEVIAKLGFSLTNAQKEVLEEIKGDFLSGSVMNRLVQGDVGSGKTAVAMVCAYICIKNGYQVALMAPTEVLAKQHYEGFRDVLEPLNIEVEFLSGSLKKKEKELALEKIKSGQAQMIIGTHAVIQEKVVFNSLGLVITDEQHRFGVNQRITLAKKGDNPHVLVMTATPIPRTLALILYGDLDISTINQMPPGRQKIDTRAVGTSYYERIYAFIKKEIAKGRQAYIVCPSIEESDKRNTQAVIEYAQTLKEGAFKNFNVAIIHGKLKNQEKQQVMEDFVAGKVQVLVSTTVIEVGVNVPNATIMVIENAEMFGLSQLHQLRGRVGRGSEQSYCVLISDSKNSVTKERLKVMQKTGDGFEISDTDLRLRGPGEFFGTKQHGLPMLKIANLYKDIDILKLAQKAANKILEEDRHILQEENGTLKEEIKKILAIQEIGI